MVNALVRTQPSLLDGSLRLLLEKPRLLDFDNKRSHIRAKLKKLAEEEEETSTPRRGLGTDQPQAGVDGFLHAAAASETGGDSREADDSSSPGEEGIDAGGLTREWYMLLAREMFQPGGGALRAQPQRRRRVPALQQQRHQRASPVVFQIHRENHEQGGVRRVPGGRALHPTVLQAHARHPAQLRRHGGVRPGLPPKPHVYMLEHPLAESGLDHLTFSETSMYFDVETNVELIPGGHDVPVTDDNKLEYVNLVTAHRMTNAIKDQIAAFTEGFNDMRALRRRSHLGRRRRAQAPHQRHPGHRRRGSPRQHRYQGYAPSAPEVRWFWEVVRRTHRGGPRTTAHVRHRERRRCRSAGSRRSRASAGRSRFQLHKAYGRGTAPLQRAHVLQSAGSSRVRHQGGTQGQAPLRLSREGSEGVRIRPRDSIKKRRRRRSDDANELRQRRTKSKRSQRGYRVAHTTRLLLEMS